MPKVFLREGGGVGHGVLGRQRPVGLDVDREAVVVGALTHAGLGHGEVGAAHGIVDGVDADQVDRHGAVHRVHLALDVAPALVHVQLDRDLAVFLDGEEQVVAVDDLDARMRLEIAGVDRADAVLLDGQRGLIDVRVDDEDEGLEPLDDLVHVLQHADDGLVFVHHAVHPEGPHGAPPEGGEQQAPERIAEGVAIAPFERLEAELGDVRVAVLLGHFDRVRPDQPGEIDAHGHFEYSSTMSCSWALMAMASRAGRSRMRPAALALSTESHAGA